MASSSVSTLFLPEPTLTFGSQQAVEDPRDGLMLFGPLDAGKPYGVRAGVIGTPRGIEIFRSWVLRIRGYLVDAGSPVANPPFPGFEAAFRIPWSADPVLTISVPDSEFRKAAFLDDRHQRVHATVSVVADRLKEADRQEEVKPDLWFVVIPDFVYEYCRPHSTVAASLQIKAPQQLGTRYGKRLRYQRSLFQEENEVAVAYEYDVDFHNQLKARLLESRILTQVVRESTIASFDELPARDRPKRDKSKLLASVAWSLTTTVFYKAGGRPWKIEGIRDGVCYIGLVFKKDQTKEDPRAACCAAQMFLDSGDGVVFRGAVGPWYSPTKDEFHMSEKAARELVTMAVSSYAGRHDNKPPRELFIHGKVEFADEEWEGFSAAVDRSATNLVGVKIRDENDFKVFRPGRMPVLRGLGHLRNQRTGYLWTRGYTPRLQTYVGREVPRPLRIEVLRGNAEIATVFADIMALTKLNYNTCILADGIPVTLRFADAVGEILTAGPVGDENPLPFKHYI